MIIQSQFVKLNQQVLQCILTDYIFVLQHLRHQQQLQQQICLIVLEYMRAMELQLLKFLHRLYQDQQELLQSHQQGVYTHAVVWAKNLMGVKHFVQVDTTITGSVSGASGTAGYCWTAAGLTTRNSAKANATCGATVDTTTYGTTYLDMECFDDACAYTGTNDANDGEYTADTGEIPGTDWQYVAGVTSAISSTDSSGITRSTNAGFMIHDTLLLCAPSTCMTGTGVETGTSTEKSMWMAQTFPTPIDTGGKTPTAFM